MDVAAYISELRTNGALLSDAAARTALDEPVPPCPGWRVRDLLKHTGMVHRWAAANITRACAEPMTADEQREAVGRYPPDESLADWFRSGHARLVGVLEAADPGLQCWTFMPAPSPLAFWARRQAHETTIHRVDAETARGRHSAAGRITPVPAAFAADGIDELLTAFLPRVLRHAPPDGMACELAVRARDTGHEWLVKFGPEPAGAPRGDARAACRISGAASDLYQLLWNRLGEPPAGADVEGDAGVLTAWHQNIQVKWRR
ncbi:MAG: maleylpyruvate isomerase family mycothiol-dependent enzyme [Micromonosporaceae bacterium]